MASHQCLRCRSALRQVFHIHQTLTTCRSQTYSSRRASKKAPIKPPVNEAATSSTKEPLEAKLDIAALLSKPTWSVRSLLPPTNTPSIASSTTSIAEGETISPTQLHHLLRLSALPQPRSPEEEQDMLDTLSTQLHFVRAIQAVDTTGVEPLVTLRDETEEGIRALTIGLENPRIKEALEAERKVGRMGRVRRRRGGEVEDRRSQEEKEWNPLEGTQGRTVGRHFVVHSGKSGSVGRAVESGTGPEAETPKEGNNTGESVSYSKNI